MSKNVYLSPVIVTKREEVKSSSCSLDFLQRFDAWVEKLELVLRLEEEEHHQREETQPQLIPEPEIATFPNGTQTTLRFL